MPKKRGFWRIRWPTIRLGRRGLRTVGPSATLGAGGPVRLNVSRSGPSISAGVPGATFNTRRGCLFSPFTLARRLFRRRRSNSPN